MKPYTSLFLLSFLLPLPLLCAQQQAESINSWKFLEYKLITAPKSLDKKAHILRLIPACISGAAASMVSSDGFDYIAKHHGGISEKRRHYTIGLFGVLGASFIYGIADAIIQHEVDLQTIYSFISQWPEYKKYTPTQLHSIFDDVYEMYLFDPHSYKYHHNALDSLTIARNHIFYKFPEVYGFHYKTAGFSLRTKRILWQFLDFAPVKMVLNTIKLFV